MNKRREYLKYLGFTTAASVALIKPIKRQTMDADTLKRIEDEAREYATTYGALDDMEGKLVMKYAYITCATKYTQLLSEKDKRIKELEKCIEDLCGFRPTVDSEFTWTVYRKNANKLLTK